MNEQNNVFPAIHFTWFVFLFILLLKIVDFENICKVSNEIGDFIGFQNLEKVN